MDDLREEGVKIGSLSIGTFRPFPLAAVREAVNGAERVIVLEKSLAVGIGGIVATDVRMALAGLSTKIYTVIAGLGGRAITKASLRKLFGEARQDRLEPVTFLDLNVGIIQRHLERESKLRRSGPVAENILLDIGKVAARIG